MMLKKRSNHRRIYKNTVSGAGEPAANLNVSWIVHDIKVNQVQMHPPNERETEADRQMISVWPLIDIEERLGLMTGEASNDGQRPKASHKNRHMMTIRTMDASVLAYCSDRCIQTSKKTTYSCQTLAPHILFISIFSKCRSQWQNWHPNTRIDVTIWKDSEIIRTGRLQIRTNWGISWLAGKRNLHLNPLALIHGAAA